MITILKKKFPTYTLPSILSISINKFIYLRQAKKSQLERMNGKIMKFLMEAHTKESSGKRHIKERKELSKETNMQS